MNEKLEKVVIDLDGKLPTRTFSERVPNEYYISTNCICLNGAVVCHIPDFIEASHARKQRSKDHE